MNVLELIVVLTASPIIAALVYGSWKFYSDEDRVSSSSSKPSSKSLGRTGRYRNLKKVLST